MDGNYLLDLFYVLAFFCGGIALGVVPMILSLLLAPRRTRTFGQKTLQAIECGVEPIGPTWIRYGVVYYLYALIFVAFSVDVLFLFPVAAVYRETADLLELWEVALFVAILALIIVYAWKKDVFSWKTR